MKIQGINSNVKFIFYRPNYTSEYRVCGCVVHSVHANICPFYFWPETLQHVLIIADPVFVRLI